MKKSKCNLCNEEEFKILTSKARFNKEVHNYICSTCGYIQVLPRNSQKQHIELYEEGGFSVIGRNSNTLTDAKIKQTEFLGYLHFLQLEKYIARELYQSKKRCLDVGCGSGAFLRYMKAAGWEVEGLEPDKQFSKKGKEIYDLNIENQFIEDFKSRKKFDLISSFHVIEHVEDPNLFLTSIYDLLSDDGYLYIECPSIDYMYGKDINFFFWDVHINTFSNQTLISFLIKNGFEIINTEELNSFVNILAKKKSKSKNKNNFNEYFDQPKRIFKLIKKRKKKLQNKKNEKKISWFKQSVKWKLRQLKKALIYSKNPDINKNKLNLLHFGFHHSKNTGDIALFECVRKQFNKEIGNINYELINLHHVIDETLLKKINESDGIIIGGGGLFLKDTNPNNISGWQWPCSIAMMDRIKVPIIIYAIGYNRFRDQDDFEPVFYENVKHLFKKASFIGMRNRGSIDSMKNYIKEKSILDKIDYQPCSTTLINDLYQLENNRRNKQIIAINISFDRHLLRFGTADEANVKLNRVCKAIKEINKIPNVECVMISHVSGDEQFDIWLKANKINIRHISLVGMSMENIIKNYRLFSLVIGMRGHAQMIPFGMNIPIISLISHNKMKYFLDDNNIKDRGIDISDIELEKKLFIATNKELQQGSDFTRNHDEIRKITIRNFDKIKHSLNVKKNK